MANMKLTGSGVHSIGINNPDGTQLTSATPGFSMDSMVELVLAELTGKPVVFSTFGGTATAPTMQHAKAGMLAAGDIIKMTVGGVDKEFHIGGASVSTSGSAFGGALGTGATEKNSAIALSNGNLTATKTSAGGYTNVRQPDTDGKSSGKYYVEISLTSINGGHGYFGMIPAAAIDVTGSMYPGVSSGKGWGYSIGDGIVYNNGVSAGTFPTSVQGNTIGIAVDLTNKLFWIRNNAGWFNGGNPAAGTGGFTLPTATAWIFDLCPYTNGDIVTINLGASAFTLAVPSGFENGISTYTLSGLKDSAGAAPSATPTAAWKEKVNTRAFGVTGYSGGSLVLTNGGSGLLATGDKVLADGVEKTLGTVSESTSSATTTTSNSTLSANTTLSSGEMTVATSGVCSGMRSTAATLGLQGNSYGTANNATMGMFDVAEVGKYNGATYKSGMDTMSKSWWVMRGSATQADIYYGSTMLTSIYGIASGDLFKVINEGGTVRFYVGGVLKYTWAQACSVSLYGCFNTYYTASFNEKFTNCAWVGATSYTCAVTLGGTPTAVTKVLPVSITGTHAYLGVLADGYQLVAKPQNGTAMNFWQILGGGVGVSGPILSGSASYTQTNTAYDNWEGSANAWRGQSFQLQTSGYVTKCRFQWNQDMSGTTFKFELVNDNSGNPGTTVYATTTGTGASSAGTDKEFTFATPYYCTAGTTYWIKITENSGATIASYLRYHGTSQYANGVGKRADFAVGDFVFGIQQDSGSCTYSLSSMKDSAGNSIYALPEKLYKIQNPAYLFNLDVTATQVPQATGTAIGNLTGTGGLAAAFDGNESQTYAQAASHPSGTTSGWIGKDWGSGNTKTITGVWMKGSSDQGFYYGSEPTVSVFLYGSNTAPTGGTDGTLLGVFTPVTDGNSLVISKTGGFALSAFRYHWVYISVNATGQNVIVAELKFFEGAGTSTTSSLKLTHANSGALVTGDKIVADGVEETLGAVVVEGSTVSYTNKSFGIGTSGVQNGMSNYTIRNKIPAGTVGVSGGYVRFTFKAASSMGLAVDAAYVGKLSGTYGFASAPTKLTFNNGSSGFSIAAGATITSDPVAFAFADGADHIVSFHVTSSGSGTLDSLPGVAGTNYWYLAANNDSANVSPTGYTQQGSYQYVGLDSVDVSKSVYTCAVTLNNVPSTVSKFAPMMNLAYGYVDEPLEKEKALTITNIWTGETGSYLLTPARILRLENGITFPAIRTPSDLVGDFDISFVWTKGSSGGSDNYWVGVYASSEDGAFVQSGTNFNGLSAMTNSFFITRGGSATKYYKGSTVQASSPNIPDGSQVNIKRTGSTIFVQVGGSTVYTWTGGVSSNMRIVIGCYGADTYNIDLANFTCNALPLWGVTTSQIQTIQASSLLPYFAGLNKDIIITVGGVDYVVQPNGTVTETDATVLVISNITGAAEHDFGSVATTEAWGQQFTSTSAFSLSKVSAKGVVHGSGCNRTVNCAIYADSGDQPTGSPLATTSIAGWTTAAETDWTFSSPPALTAGVKYWAVWTTTVDSNNYIGFLHDNSDTLAGGQCKRGSTATTLSWTPGSGYDSWFKVHAAGKVTTIPHATQVSAATAARLRSRFQTPVAIASAVYNPTGPKIALTGKTVTLPSNPLLKRLALKLQGTYDATLCPHRASLANIQTMEY